MNGGQLFERSVHYTTSMHPESIQGKQRQRHSSALKYTMAIACVALALVITHLLDPLFNRATLFLLLAVVTLSTWLGGLGTGSVALALSGLGAWYFLLPPRVSFQVQDPQDIVRFVFFLSVSTIAMVSLRVVASCCARSRSS